MQNQRNSQRFCMISIGNHRFSRQHQTFIMFPFDIQSFVETLLPQTIHFTGLRICLTHNHCTYSIISLFDTEPTEIGNDIVYQCIKVRFMFNDLVAVNITFSDFYAACQLVKNILYFLFIDCFDRFPHEFQCITVCY